MNHENEDTYHPEIHHIREEDEEHRKSMMQSILIKVTLRPNKNMLEKSPKMFSKLNSIINLHCVCGLIEWIDISNTIRAVATTAQPCWHEAGWK